MSEPLTLLAADGTTFAEQLNPVPLHSRPVGALRSRQVYAAAHVIPRATAANVPGAPADIDWDATLAFRHHLWSWGLGVADAMDTAQRNMGLGTAACRELIRRSAREAGEVDGHLLVGINTDHIADESISLDSVIDAYRSQLEFAEDCGAGVVMMASRHLARAAGSAADYRRVYDAVLTSASAPVVLHWLGTAFDPALTGYFGSTDTATASSTVLDIIRDNDSTVSGIKMSLLDAAAEVALRSRLDGSARLFTGDDFNYVDLIAGDGTHHSDALLGAFAAVGPSASAAIQALDDNDPDLYRRILGPTQDLSRQIFAAPTFHYKTGIAFLAWLNNHQPSFSLIGGLHSARSLPHLSEIVRLANDCGALEHPEIARERWHRMLEINGCELRKKVLA